MCLNVSQLALTAAVKAIRWLDDVMTRGLYQNDFLLSIYG